MWISQGGGEVKSSPGVVKSGVHPRDKIFPPHPLLKVNHCCKAGQIQLWITLDLDL
jgi:hypothetical protein